MTLDRSLVAILLAVVTAHACLILWALTGAFSEEKTFSNTPRLVVTTLSLQPQVVSRTGATTTAATPPKKKPVVKEPQKKIAKKAPEKKKAPQNTPPNSIADNTLLDAAKAALKQMQDPSQNPSATGVKSPLQSQTYIEPTQPSYAQDLGLRLQRVIRLPEYGEVSIQLTLNRDGSVDHVKILSAESERNRHYVQQEIPNLRFLAFGNQFPKEEKHTFSLVIKNE